MGIPKRRTSKLKVRGYVHSVVDSGSSSDHGLAIQRVGKSQAWRYVIAIHWNISVSRRGEVRCPQKVTRQVHQAGYINRNAYATVATEIAVLDQVVPFRVGCAPLIPHAEIHGQFGTDLPIVLNVERGLFRLIGYRFEYRQAARA